MRLSLLTLITLALTAAAAAPLPAPPFDRLPAVQFIGPDSKIDTPRFILIKDDAAWNKLWAEHSGVDPSGPHAFSYSAPRIDFSRFMVVGAFEGAAINTDGDPVTSIRITDDSILIRYEPSTFQTVSLDGKPDTGVSAQPFGLWVIDRADNKPITLERAHRTLLTDPVTWKQVKTFDNK